MDGIVFPGGGVSFLPRLVEVRCDQVDAAAGGDHNDPHWMIDGAVVVADRNQINLIIGQTSKVDAKSLFANDGCMLKALAVAFYGRCRWDFSCWSSCCLPPPSC